MMNFEGINTLRLNLVAEEINKQLYSSAINVAKYIIVLVLQVMEAQRACKA